MRLIGNDIKEAEKTMDMYITDSVRNVMEHPSCPGFIQALKNAQISNEDAEKLWRILIAAYRKQYEALKNPQSAVAAVPAFQEFARIAGEGTLLDTGNEELALWTGGYEMSLLAQKLGYCTLEKTIIGKILDTTKITSLWNVESKLWNEISREFVDRYTKKVVHIYFRTLDELSVLLRQEVPQLEAKKTVIHWHPIYNNGLTGGVLNACSEVGLDGRAINIEARNQGFTDVKKAGDALQEMLRTKPYTFNMSAYKSANFNFFEPSRPPFALY